MFVVYRLEFIRNEGRVVRNEFIRLGEFKTLTVAEEFMNCESMKNKDEDVSFTIVME